MAHNEKVALVTGAGSGLGRAIGLRLAAEGFSVLFTDIDPAAAESAADEAGLPAMSVRCDVTDPASVETACELAVKGFGGVDVLVNNAGLDIPAFFLESDAKSWKTIIDVDLFGVLNCTKTFAPLIAERCRENGYGRIINVASDAGRVGSMGEAVYSAAKGGVIAFSKSMARELARDRVTVNAVCPGPADTPMTAAINEEPLGQKMMGGMLAATPFKRLVQPDEVAAAVSFFASDDARFITGQVLSVSGGLTMAG